MIDKHGHEMITAVLAMLNALPEPPDDTPGVRFIDVKLHNRDHDVVVTFTDEFGEWMYEVESR